MYIIDDDIVKHCQKSNNGEMETKKNNNNIDITMGAFNRSKMCELVGTFLLWRLASVFDVNDFDLHHDPGF